MTVTVLSGAMRMNASGVTGGSAGAAGAAAAGVSACWATSSNA
jgi:hypothetical protein